MPNINDVNNQQSKAWCFTLNNYTEEEKAFIDSMDDEKKRDESGISYIIYGIEIGESGTRHLQGYIEFSKRIRLSGCRKLLQRAHFERRRGTSLQGVFLVQLSK